MAGVLMAHPRHGWHHFYSPAEVEQAKANGWAVVEPKPEPQVQKIAPAKPRR
jgi:hypothetical protein